jgi:hypothetical protein
LPPAKIRHPFGMLKGMITHSDTRANHASLKS